MSEMEKFEAASRQLDRVLSFFGRVDAKSSGMFAINAGILAFAMVNLRFGDLGTWYVAIPFVIGLLCTFVALAFVYRCSFPNLQGGHGSLVYFSEIAKRTEASYLTEFFSQTSDDHARDLLAQAWRNSAILKIKFEALKSAFLSTAFSLVPWGFFLAASSVLHSTVPRVT